MTETEAAMVVRGLEEYLALIESTFEPNSEDLREYYGFNPAHYSSMVCMLDLMEAASGMSRERLRQVEWWRTFEELDAKEWAEFAPRCELPVAGEVGLALAA
ncbi:MAG: hypothetical protein AAFX78_05010 [Cyanobacteria bacterium J06638_20]